MKLNYLFQVTLLPALVLALRKVAVRGADDPKTTEKVIPATEIREHVGQECTALMKVKASKNATPSALTTLIRKKIFTTRKTSRS